ncbi:hypothetical protein HYALB_00008663 [Hymenoscyphus albidus]|uniref:Peptidase S8/S53 domain-containing protein n=1 Tax=Hymenoscyphus albidus TaxID=595503 RepID=A0A9N9LIF1_9HELO|nr:hypothetical protein HYALB_00008663 [Hymenoscyphus albidus]
MARNLLTPTGLPPKGVWKTRDSGTAILLLVGTNGVKQAVEACIHGTFLFDLIQDEGDATEPNPNYDLALQKAIYNNVVRLLKEELIAIDETLAKRILSNTTSDMFFTLPSISGIRKREQARSPQVNIPVTSQQSTLCESIYTESENDKRVFDFKRIDSDNRKASSAADFFKKMDEINSLLVNREDIQAIKVAILDTGVYDGFREKSNIVSYYDFVDLDFIEGHSASKDNTGHGTDMVHLLQMTAPHAEIYVARVFDGDYSDQNTVKNVAKARYLF